MAAIVTGAIGEVAALLGGSGLAATIGRGALGGVVAIGASQLLKAIEADLGAGGTQAATARRLTPPFAIVDLHSNKVVKPLSAHRTYVILTHRARKSRAQGRRGERVIIAPNGSEVVTVR